jgi:hypothetical protein
MLSKVFVTCSQNTRPDGMENGSIVAVAGSLSPRENFAGGLGEYRSGGLTVIFYP